MIRRLVALTVGAAMLHLNAQRADVACADHRDGARAPLTSGTHQQHDGMVGTNHSQDRAPGEQCESPAHADCCHAMAACSPSLGELSSAVEVAAPQLSDLAVVLTQSPAASRITAPEPPPPRA